MMTAGRTKVRLVDRTGWGRRGARVNRPAGWWAPAGRRGIELGVRAPEHGRCGPAGVPRMSPDDDLKRKQLALDALNDRAEQLNDQLRDAIAIVETLEGKLDSAIEKAE